MVLALRFLQVVFTLVQVDGVPTSCRLSDRGDAVMLHLSVQSQVPECGSHAEPWVRADVRGELAETRVSPRRLFLCSLSQSIRHGKSETLDRGRRGGVWSPPRGSAGLRGAALLSGRRRWFSRPRAHTVACGQPGPALLVLNLLSVLNLLWVLNLLSQDRGFLFPSSKYPPRRTLPCTGSSASEWLWGRSWVILRLLHGRDGLSQES